MSATVTKAFIISTWFAFYSVRARFASLSHQTTFITLIILWHSDEHFHPVTPSESSITETPVSAAIINWLNIQVEKGPAWNPALGTARILTTTECQEWRETETIGGDSTIANGNNRYHVTSWREGSWEKHSDAQSNTNGYYKMCQWLPAIQCGYGENYKTSGAAAGLGDLCWITFNMNKWPFFFTEYWLLE